MMDDAAPESDSRLPSGRWTGWWEQGSQRGKMQLHLTFEEGRVFGEGRDAVGDFTFGGSYSLERGRADLLKTYLGGHYVDYQGAITERGIKGEWLLKLIGRVIDAGPFHIWPEKLGAGEALSEARQEEIPATASG